MPVPVIAIIGRPNVGKSTLFNVLTNSRDALVYDKPGVTRDRIFGDGCFGSHGQEYIVVDTGGINFDEEGIDACMAEQSLKAANECDLILWMVDARAGLTPVDEQLAEKLRVASKPVVVVANKIDGLNPDIALADFYSLGMGEPEAIAASHKRGVTQLIDNVFERYLSLDKFIQHKDANILEALDGEDSLELDNKPKQIKISIIGRPNVGKSTLTNRLLGEERVVVYDQPGTTRDSIYIPFERQGREYILIDTAGVRKRGRINDVVEKFSVVKALQAIRDSHVVILLIDSSEKLTEQDMHLLSYTKEHGKSLIIACNKWDGLDDDQKSYIKSELDRKLSFVDYGKRFHISAKYGTNVGHLWKNINDCFDSVQQDVTTSDLTSLLEEAINAHQPPLVNGRRIKLRYAHLGSNYPFLIIIHGKQTESIPDHYKRYLASFFLNKLKLVGTPILLFFKTDDNPYKHIRNTLTPRQFYKRQRMIKHRKSKK